MTTAGSFSSELRDLYTTESARIREEFAATGNGWAAISQRTALVEKIALHLWKEMIDPEEQGPQNFTLVALGGFGRKLAFSPLRYRSAFSSRRP
jgi:UTP:GlnB (protein PII) uridylyltransferase